MNLSIKQSINILSKDPHITLLLVSYLLIMAMLLPTLLTQKNELSFFIVLFLMFIFSCAFFSGWFGMIKSCVLYKEKEDIEENLKQKYDSFKMGFFGSIPTYILQIGFFILILIGVIHSLSVISNHLFGKTDEIITQIAMIANSKEAIANFLSTLPEEVVINLVKKSVFSYTGIFLYVFLTMYMIPALYFSGRKNPLIGIKDGLVAIIKKPFFSIGLFLTLVLIHGMIVLIEGLSIFSQITMFLSLILRVCFIAFVVVLIFSVYEKNFTANNNNGSNGLRENSSCD